MKGILKKVAGAFVEMDDKILDIKKPVAAQTTQQVQQAVQPLYQPSAEYEKFRKQFSDILADENKRNYPGNDYFEFVVMKNAMSAIAQENIKYQAAFAGWMTGGNQTKKSLLDTAQLYLGLVQKEITEFEEAYKQQYDSQVVKNQSIIDSKTAEIQKATELINNLTAEVGRLKDENLQKTAKLNLNHDAFMAAGEAQRQEILDEITKINQHII